MVVWSAIFTIAAVVASTRTPDNTAALTIAGICGAVCAWAIWRLVRPASKPPRSAIDLKQGAKRSGEELQMLLTLEELGVPLDLADARGDRVVSAGLASAALYRAYNDLKSGRAVEGLAALEEVLSLTKGASDSGSIRVRAVAHYLIGKIHQASGDRSRAMAEFSESLKLSPDYLLARAAMETSTASTENH